MQRAKIRGAVKGGIIDAADLIKSVK